MRILLVNQTYPPDVQATGQLLASVAEALVQRGHHVTVATGCRAYDDPATIYPARASRNGVNVVRLWHWGCGDRGKLSRLADFSSFLIALAAWGLVQPRYDVLVTLTTPPLVSVVGAVLAAARRSRLVCWMMDVNPDEAIAVGWLRADSLPARVMEALSRWSLRRAKTVIALDDHMRDRIAAKGILADRIVTLPLWMDRAISYDAPGRETFRAEHGLKDKFVVMYSGNHTPCHPLETLVEAARLCRSDASIHFCFIGGGLEWPRLRDLTQGWSNVTFLRYRPLAELAGVLSSADAQVVVMGDAFVGIVHPCKIYNIMAARRPFIYIGPARSSVADLIRDARLGAVAASFHHGEGARLAEELLRRSRLFHDHPGSETDSWPDEAMLAAWTEGEGRAKVIEVILAGDE